VTNWFYRLLRRPPTIDGLTLDTVGWKFLGERMSARMRGWETSTSDAVSMHFCNLAPDLPVVKTEDKLRAFFEPQVKGSGAEIVELRVETVAGFPAVRMLIKVPRSPHGMTYQGAFTIPFRDFSFVIKAQSSEIGTTGVREMTLMERRLAAWSLPNTSGSGPLFQIGIPIRRRLTRSFRITRSRASVDF
jgi:hypothetical protein